MDSSKINSIWIVTTRIYVLADNGTSEQFEHILGSRESRWSTEKLARREVARLQRSIRNLDFKEYIKIACIEQHLNG